MLFTGVDTFSGDTLPFNGKQYRYYGISLEVTFTSDGSEQDRGAKFNFSCGKLIISTSATHDNIIEFKTVFDLRMTPNKLGIVACKMLCYLSLA